MAHQIESMFSARELPWHGLGIVTADTLNKSDAIIQSGLDWTVSKRELYLGDNGNLGLQALEAFAVTRDTDSAILGIVGEGYNPIQNSESFDFAEALLAEGATFETAGSLFGGKRIFICAKLRETDILDDKVGEYLVLANSFDGTMPFTGMITPIRVVCNNTLKLAGAQASRIVKLRHTKNVGDKVDQARKILSLAHKYTDQIKLEAERMVAIGFDNRILDDFTNRIFGVTDDASTRAKNLAETGRELFEEALNRPDIRNFSGTAWGTFQALADVDSHKPAPREGEISKHRNFFRVIEGDNWLENSTKLMLEMADAE
jgi:phage/plasmid-like protein (TIGR03299 family)